jgi:hypothetical protein
VPPPSPPTTPTRAFLWPAAVSLAAGAALVPFVWFVGIGVAAFGLLVSGIAAWARLPPSESIPRLVALLLAAIVIVYLYIAAVFGQ